MRGHVGDPIVAVKEPHLHFLKTPFFALVP